MPHYLMPSPLEPEKRTGSVPAESVARSLARCASCRAFVYKYSTDSAPLRLLPSPSRSSWRNGNCIFSWAKTMGTSISNLPLPPLIGAVFAQRLGFLCRAWLPTCVVPIPAAAQRIIALTNLTAMNEHATQIRNRFQCSAAHIRFSQITRMVLVS